LRIAPIPTLIPLLFFKMLFKINLKTVESTGIKFPDMKGSGVSVRSQRMKMPANVGQKKIKGVEQLLQELAVGELPPSFEMQ